MIKLSKKHFDGCAVYIGQGLISNGHFCVAQAEVKNLSDFAGNKTVYGLPVQDWPAGADPGVFFAGATEYRRSDFVLSEYNDKFPARLFFSDYGVIAIHDNYAALFDLHVVNGPLDPHEGPALSDPGKTVAVMPLRLTEDQYEQADKIRLALA